MSDFNHVLHGFLSEDYLDLITSQSLFVQLRFEPINYKLGCFLVIRIENFIQIFALLS